MDENFTKRIIPFSPPDISDLEIAEVVEALRSGWITIGPRTKMLECRLAAYIETGDTAVDCNDNVVVLELVEQEAPNMNWSGEMATSFF